MDPINDHSDPAESPDFDRLRGDLKALYRPDIPVPSGVDDAILDLGRSRLAGARPRILRWRPFAAAAAVLLAAGAWFAVRQVPEQTPVMHAVAVREDINGDGAVNILDAFQLARRIEAGEMAHSHDINGDRVVDLQDVHTVAQAAVSLQRGSLQ